MMEVMTPEQADEDEDEGRNTLNILAIFPQNNCGLAIPYLFNHSIKFHFNKAFSKIVSANVVGMAIPLLVASQNIVL